jgi:hypothetical protein
MPSCVHYNIFGAKGVRRNPEVVSIDNFKAGFFPIDNFVTSCKKA